MITISEKDIIGIEADISDRFEEKTGVIKKLKVLSKDIEKKIWNKLIEVEIIKDYSMNPIKFEDYEFFEFSNNYDLVLDKLNSFKNLKEEVVLIWFASQNSILTDFETFKENWDYFFYPSSDDLVIINKDWKWVIYLSHYEVMEIGVKIKIEKNL